MNVTEKNRLLALHGAQYLEENLDGVTVLYREDGDIMLLTTWGIETSWFRPSTSTRSLYSLFADNVLITRIKGTNIVYYDQNLFVQGEVKECYARSGGKYIICQNYIIFGFGFFVKLSNPSEAINAVVQKLDFKYLSNDVYLIRDNNRAIFISGSIKLGFDLFRDGIIIDVFLVHENIVAIFFGKTQLRLIIKDKLSKRNIRFCREENPVIYEDGKLTVFSFFGTKLCITGNINNLSEANTADYIAVLENAAWQYPDDGSSASAQDTPPGDSVE